jgi:dipicolinate synthase subunit B
MLAGIKIGFGITGSFCTLDKVIDSIIKLKNESTELFCFVTENIISLDTRFGKAHALIEKLTNITGKDPISNIVDAEKFGPLQPLDCMVIAPITGSSIAKFAYGINDNAVLMAAKATLRNRNPVILSLSTNDALGINGINIMKLFNTKNIFFVPFGQDDPISKPNSMSSNFSDIYRTVKFVLSKREQIQPAIISYINNSD